ncbi:MAG: NifU family protein [Candidatus Limnocylindria bacterium]
MERPILTLTEGAKQKIDAVRRSTGHPHDALRIAIAGRSGGRFQYDLALVGPVGIAPDDVVLGFGDLQVVVEGASATRIHGTTIDLEPSLTGGSLTIENPNEGWAGDPLAERVQQVIDSRINPGVASHGGHVALLEVRDGAAYIQLGGGCQGCGQVDVTLKHGIETAIRDAVPEITRIVDTTDHAAGSNPYYQPSKK